MENQTESRPPNNPSPSTEVEGVWFNLAIAGAFVLVILVLAGVISAWSEIADSRRFSERIDVVYKLGLFGAGLVTFCTVAWRGLVSTRQVNALIVSNNNQAAQIALTTRQLEANERSELVKTFQKGAELLSSETAAQRSAAIGTLQSIARAKEQFAKESIELLAEHVGVCGSHDPSSPETARAVAVLASLSKETGIKSNYIIRMHGNEQTEWEFFRLPFFISYKKGNIGNKFYRRAVPDGGFAFDKTKLTNIEIDLFKTRAYGCSLNGCKIIRVTDTLLMINSYQECDFSDCQIDDLEVNRTISGRQNFYIDGKEPYDIHGDPLPKEFLERNFVKMGRLV